MPRLPRIEAPGELSYITCRAGQEVALFQDEQDIKTYLALLHQYKAQYRFKLLAYALMKDHLHLCLETGPEGTVSEIMHDLNSRYTKLYGARHGYTGHLFQGRYKATLVEKGLYLAPLTRHLHLHSEAVADSLSSYLKSDSSGVDTAEVLSRFPAEDRAGAYELFLQEAGTAELEQFEALLQQPFVGSHGFVEGLTQRLQSPSIQMRSSPDQEDPPAPVGERRSRLIPQRIFEVAVTAAIFGVFGVWMNGNRQSAPVVSPVQVIIQAPAAQGDSSQGKTISAGRLAVFVPPSPLAGTAWQIQVQPTTLNGAHGPQVDSLRFEGNKVISSLLSSQGFSSTNYTVTPQENGALIWETMQTNLKGEVVCWRGELSGDSMRGLLTRQKPGEQTTNFHFVGEIQEKAPHTASEI